MKAFQDIPPTRTDRIQLKPREYGITVVIDTGFSIQQTKDLCSFAGDYIDVVKLGFGTSKLYDRTVLQDKIRTFNQHGIEVMTGGTLFEIAFIQDTVPTFLNEAESLGFSVIEISDGTISLSTENRRQSIRDARNHGFKVISEVGKKKEGCDLSTEEYVQQLKTDLQEDVFKATVEARGSGRGFGIYDEAGRVRTNRFDVIIGEIDPKNIVFEAPQTSQQAFLIDALGSNVNLGNINPYDVLSCETLRQGLRGDTMKV